MHVDGEGRRLTRKQTVWLEHLRAWEASGEAGTSYAAAHGFRPQQLYRWRSRFEAMGLLERQAEDRRKGSCLPSRGGGHPAAGFIAARLASSEERGGGTGIRIRFRNGVMLEMDLSCAGAVGTELLTHLATLP